jgi:uncharacterized protein (TIGR03435 family)
MKDDKSKDDVELLGEFLRDRAPSLQEERSVLDRVWQEMSRNDLPQQVRQEFQPAQIQRSQKQYSMTRYVWAVGAAAVVIAVVIAGLAVRNSSPALVAKAEGFLERVHEDGNAPVRPGEKLSFGEVIRAGSNSSTVLTLNDGSQIEIRSNSALALEKADDGIRIRLDKGGVFITAAKQRSGHLYVHTKDVTVSVEGTVFLVNVEEAGSRVAVVEGEVKVQQGEKTSRLSPGQQVATNPLMVEHPVVEQLAWSYSAEPYLTPLQQDNRLEFETAVLRPISGTGRFITRPRCKGIDGEFRPVGQNAPPVPLGRCVADSTILQNLLTVAYDIERISGLASFAEQPVFQLEARAEDPTRATREELRQMLQNFLVEKLKLKVHRETKEMDGYVLTIGKDGVKFKETSGDEEIPRWLPNGDPRIDASGQVLPTMYEGKARMNLFVNSLSGVARMPIVDKSGLQGLYHISFIIDLLLPPTAGGGRRGGNGANAEPLPPQDFDPPLPNALEQQLGLHLERGKVPVEYLVVDHYERVPEN